MANKLAGVGADYPLSSCIVCEFAPKQHRSRMLAWLFFMQPLGQFMATLIAAAVTASFHSGMQDPGSCQSPECFRAVDRAWRWIVGIGGLPALLAWVIRLQIPESPRYTMDVLMDGKKALKDTKEYFIVADDAIPFQDGNGSLNGNLLPSSEVTPNAFSSGAQTANHAMGQNGTASLSMNGQAVEQRESPTANIHRQHEPPVSIPIHASTSRPRSTSNGDNRDRRTPLTFQEWWSGFKEYFIREGNVVHLAGTMTTWGLLDTSFYGLGMSSPVTIQKIFNDQKTLTSPADTNSTVYSILMGNAWHPLIVVSLPALLGGLAMTYVIQHSRPVKVQRLFFVVLAVFFFIVGGLFQKLLDINQGHWGLVALYMFCQFFFNLGPNATTFIVSSMRTPVPFAPPHRVYELDS